MGKAFHTELIGKTDVSSHLSSCDACGKLVLLSSYTTRRFLKFMALPLAPSRRFRVLDECPACGHRGITTRRRHARERKKNLDLMMDGFTSAPDDPKNCLHALHTLMLYDEDAWFKDVRKTYGARFETDPRVQLEIARGLCRFGEYDQAMEHCHKALELGGGEKANDLHQFCLSAIVASKHSLDLEDWVVKEESAAKAYVPVIFFATILLTLLVSQSVSALRTNRAWIVNGALRDYAFTLDGTEHSLAAGERRQIKLELGDHELRMENGDVTTFTYSIPLARQLLEKHLLVINPDTLALLRVEDETEAGSHYVQGRFTHALSGVGYPLFAFRKEEADRESARGISMFRPKTHMEVVERLRDLNEFDSGKGYARRALNFSPESDEAEPLLHVALEGATVEFAKSFLKNGLARSPTLLVWHEYHQNYARRNGFAAELIPEYTARCRERPDEPESFYLLGQALINRDMARQFFLRSEKGRGMGGLGYYSIAQDHFAWGENDKALERVEQALSVSPNNADFSDLREQILFAKRDFKALLKTALLDETLQSAERRALILTLSGYHLEAEDLATTFAGGAYAARLNAIRYHAVGNVKSYLTEVENSDDPTAGFQRMVFEHRVEQADAALAEMEARAWREHLLMYCEAAEHGHSEIADRHLRLAAEKTRHDDFTHLEIYRLLTETEPPTRERVVELRTSPAGKALLCVALGHRFPERRAEFNTLARRYNFSATYPSLLIKRWSAAHGPVE